MNIDAWNPQGIEAEWPVKNFKSLDEYCACIHSVIESDIIVWIQNKLVVVGGKSQKDRRQSSDKRFSITVTKSNASS